MQSQIGNYKKNNNYPQLFMHEQVYNQIDLDFINENQEARAFLFQGCFGGCMDMYSDIQTVADYLNAHEGWFCRCAQPMIVEPIDDRGYTLIIGRFGSFGYEIEPKIAVVLQPPIDRLYLMHTIPVPEYKDYGYDVNYQAAMELEEVSSELLRSKPKSGSVPSTITKVKWQLDLKVTVDFPKFIHKLPSSIVQCTGDRALAQIVRQVSPRLTYKVQKDFHSRLNLPVPPKNNVEFDKIDRAECKVSELIKR